ncbi:MAG: transcriptional regulator [Actinomycetota bacterium]
MSHPRTKLDGIIHNPTRLSLLAALAKADSLEFKFLRDTLDVSDSVLSRQIASLEEAGYVKVKKGYAGKRPRTWLSLTQPGSKAFEEHVQVLMEIVG